MPYKSKSQELACRLRGDPRWNCDAWMAETPNFDALPWRVGGKSKRSPRKHRSPKRTKQKKQTTRKPTKTKRKRRPTKGKRKRSNGNSIGNSVYK